MKNISIELIDDPVIDCYKIKICKRKDNSKRGIMLCISYEYLDAILCDIAEAQQYPTHWIKVGTGD